jgi:CRP-like cAMP-binding protein
MNTELKNIELFNNLAINFEQELYKVSKTIIYKKGSNPFYPEDLLRYFYMVIDGKIKTYQINFDNNKEQTIFIYKRGDMFDVVSLLDNKPHEVVFEVLEDCKVLQIPIEKVRFWLDTNPTFNKKFFPYLAQTMRHTEQLATDIALYDTKDRLVNLLLDNINPNKTFKYQLLQNLSNSEIAKLLGTVRHVVERTIKQLNNDNIIEKSRKSIKILNFKKLLNKTY